MAFLDRLWQDWCPGYEAGEDLRNVKQCLRGEGNLAAAIGYYRAEEQVVEGAGHFPHVEKPAAVNDQILAWVSV